MRHRPAPPRPRVLLAVVLLSAAVGSAPAAPPLPEDERIGRKLAEAVIESARAYAQAGRRDWVACDAPAAGGAAAGAGATDATQPICSAEQGVASAVAQAALLREEDRRAGAGDTGATEAACYSWLLDKGLDSRQSIVRLHVLMRMFDLCDQGSFMTEEGKRRCPDYVEKGCLLVLRHDSNGLNRQVALEILGAGYASEASDGVLEDLVAKPVRSSAECRKVFTGGTDAGDPVSLEDINRKYGNARSPCERELSRGLLKALQDQRNQASPTRPSDPAN
jgi:hypothetical protein